MASKEEFIYELRIPKERIAVLIGKRGEIKRNLEKETKTKIEVNSEEGEIKIAGEDALLLYLARELIRAIGRGFNPEIAQQLLKQDYAFEILYLNEYASKPSDQKRLKGRVIGEGGKSREVIEGLTNSHICVYGKTIGIIGPSESIMDARKAVESLLSGSTHPAVYRWLEKRKRERRISI